MNKLKDTDLREALRRKYANTPQLPDDFMDSIMKRMEAEPKPAKVIRLWCWAAAAACLLLMIGIGWTMMPIEEQGKTEPLTAQQAKETPVQQACTDSTKALYAQYKRFVLEKRLLSSSQKPSPKRLSLYLSGIRTSTTPPRYRQKIPYPIRLRAVWMSSSPNWQNIIR